jgi:hypothetical protein
MDNNLNPKSNESAETSDLQNRRELLNKVGKFAVYAAPFTIMAVNAKAASGGGPGPHSSPSGSARH